MNIFAINPFIGNNNNITFSAKKNVIKKASAKQLEKDIIEFTRKLTPKQQEMFEREKAVLEMSYKGMTQKEIAEKLGIAPSAVNVAAKKSDAYQRVKAIRDKKILDMLVQGASRKEIAEKMEISESTVNQVAEEFGAFDMYRVKRDKKILELLSKGLQAKEIAKILDISDSTVSRVAHKNGIYLHPKRK